MIQKKILKVEEGASCELKSGKASQKSSSFSRNLWCMDQCWSNLRNGPGVGSNDVCACVCVCTRVLQVCVWLVGLEVEVSTINLETDLWVCRRMRRKIQAAARSFQRISEQGCVWKIQLYSIGGHLEMEALLWCSHLWHVAGMEQQGWQLFQTPELALRLYSMESNGFWFSSGKDEWKK